MPSKAQSRAVGSDLLWAEHTPGRVLVSLQATGEAQDEKCLKCTIPAHAGGWACSD